MAEKTVEQVEHSPLPWRLERRGLPAELVDVWLVSGEGDELATFYSNDGADDPKWLPYEGNAAFIVTACNSHYNLLDSRADLLAACKEFVRKCECGEASSRRSYAQMKAAIAKAEGDQ